jgi:hypothetical protein
MPTKCTFSLNFNLRETANLKPPTVGSMPHVVSNKRCRLVVYVRALGYIKVLPQNLPGEIKENNYVTFLCFSYTSIENVRNL